MAFTIERIGCATLYLGDCREVLPTLEAESVDMIFTDPPYGHANHDGDLNAMLNKHRGLENQPIANDGREEMRALMDAMLHEAARILRSESCCCCCCCCGGGPKPSFAWLADRMDRDGLQFFHECVWDKVNPGLGWRFRRQHELLMFAHRKGGKFLWADESVRVPNVIKIYPDRNREHPNEKPLFLCDTVIAAIAKPGNLVLDPCMGSGTTLVSCVNKQIECIGIEVDPKHFSKACERVERAVKQTDLFVQPQATLLSIFPDEELANK